ncbi:hypothetical protein WJX73_007796 [Symbiochloris irregularis]|uniref:Methylated-DNA--protein-cysteine methyltransferase n=1 Tax=Symbiochloris irregularis TaxID=706552 RepID=A0AAW1PU91_9CHLO
MVAKAQAGATEPGLLLHCQAKEARSPTAFEKRLYSVCKAIPKGKVATYGTLAALTKSSPRAVGQALKRNPFAPEVPCHRVVASTLKIGGFQGDWGDTLKVRNKQKMLEAEGVRFQGSQLADRAFVATAEDLRSHQQKASAAASTGNSCA